MTARTLADRVRDLADELHQEGFEGFYDGDEATRIWRAAISMRLAADLIERRREEMNL